MMNRIFYDKRVDLCRVIPGLSINLSEALRTGVVKDTGTEVSYNGIEDPSLIRGRVSDVFEAIQERNSVVNKELARVRDSSNDSVNPEAGGTL